MAQGLRRADRRLTVDWRKHYELVWNMATPEPTKPAAPTDGMSLSAFLAARDAIFEAARRFDLPADCTRCKHFDMGDCRHHGQPIPKEFQQLAEACQDWLFDGVPF